MPVHETIVRRRIYVVDADSPEQAVQLAEAGETVQEQGRDPGEVTSRVAYTATPSPGL